MDSMTRSGIEPGISGLQGKRLTIRPTTAFIKNITQKIQFYLYNYFEYGCIFVEIKKKNTPETVHKILKQIIS